MVNSSGGKSAVTPYDVAASPTASGAVAKSLKVLFPALKLSPGACRAPASPGLGTTIQTMKCPKFQKAPTWA